ncbi:MAG: hypothetical protein EAZ92_17325 [Candidatus Kapaibacterium sp.]|nr:MAG: hypothetical protein EAZ92_17325 [Candidatus Kapabacteria bacterium]
MWCGFRLQMFMVWLLGTIFFGATTQPLTAQDSTGVSASTTLAPRIGMWASAVLSRHTLDFAEFRTTPLFAPRSAQFPGPPNLRFLSGSGISAGGVFELPFSPQFGLSLRLAYTQHHALLQTEETVLLGDVNGTSSENIIEYRINARPATLGTEAFAYVAPFGGGLRLLGGMGAGYVFSRGYSQEEAFRTPPRGGFTPNGDQVFNAQTGEIPDVQPLQLWVSGGVSYTLSFPFGPTTLEITPEFAYSYALSSMLQASSVPSGQAVWNAHYVRGGVKITLPLFSEKPLRKAENDSTNARKADSLARLAHEQVAREQDSLNTARLLDSTQKASAIILTAPVRSNAPKVSIYAQQALTKAQNLANTQQIDIKPVSIVRFAKRVQGRDVSEEEENEALVLPVQELLVRDELPLLPFIFFDGESSITLPERYTALNVASAAQFTPDALKASSKLVSGSHAYYDVLNILGWRMRKLPNARLDILGCTDGFTSEKNRPRLGEVRANVVADYLRTVWNIDSTRLSVSELRGSAISSKASRPLAEADKQAENRRVELSSDTNALLAPLLLTDTISHALTPVMRFYLIVPPTLSVKSWKVRIRQGRQAVKEFRGTGKPPLAIDWRVDAKEMEKLRENPADEIAPLECSFDILEQDGAGISSPTQKIIAEERRFRVNANERVENMLVERQSLILFDGVKSTLTQEHVEILKGLNARMTSSSKVLFEGFMDKSGDEEFNERLSLARAQAAARALRFNTRGAQVEIKAYGSNKVLFDSRTPEGRIYSRTVRITQETPVQE